MSFSLPIATEALKTLHATKQTHAKQRAHALEATKKSIAEFITRRVHNFTQDAKSEFPLALNLHEEHRESIKQWDFTASEFLDVFDSLRGTGWKVNQQKVLADCWLNFTIEPAAPPERADTLSPTAKRSRKKNQPKSPAEPVSTETPKLQPETLTTPVDASAFMGRPKRHHRKIQGA